MQTGRLKFKDEFKVAKYLQENVEKLNDKTIIELRDLIKRDVGIEIGPVQINAIVKKGEIDITINKNKYISSNTQEIYRLIKRVEALEEKMSILEDPHRRLE